MADYTVIGAALAGAVVGLILLRWAGARDTEDRARSEATPVPEASTPTGYARRPMPTAGPILLAVGLALFGVGLAIGSGDAGLDARPLVPGAVVLVAALAATLRRGNVANTADREASGHVDPASAGREDSAVPSALDPEHPTPDRGAPPRRRESPR
jgi:hypothetical protein